MTKKSEETVSVNKKNFILLSKKEMEDRKNPLSKHYVGNKNVLTKKGMARSMSTANCNKTNYEELIFAKSGFHSIKHGPIFGLESDDVNQAIEFLNANLNARLKNAEERKRKGQLPLPRDGQTMEAYENGFIIFGGNRNKFPFNDIFVFNP